MVTTNVGQNVCQAKLNDYKQIRRDPSYSKLRTVDTYKIHQFSKSWLQESLDECRNEKNVVITHHAPSVKSVPHTYKDEPVTSAYASNLKNLLSSINLYIGYMDISIRQQGIR